MQAGLNQHAGLILEFSNPRGEPRRIDGSERLCFEGEVLVSADGQSVIAKHVDHRWQLTERSTYTRLQIDAELYVRFYAYKHLQSRRHGPYKSFSCVDGVAYAEHSIIAFCDSQLGDWYSYHDGRHWKTMVVEQAGST